MHIEKLSLINFKNYEEVMLNFSEKINCIVGKNGSGKTNLLDAIYYLSTSKSALNKIDNQNIRFGEPFFSIVGSFRDNEDSYKVDCALKEGTKKRFRVNGVEYEKLREHIGRFPTVFITPNDTDIVREGSEIRRKFFDQVICQMDRKYLDDLLAYNHYLKQRNSLLKKFGETNTLDKAQLEPYDVKLIQLSKNIESVRKQFMKPFNEYFLKVYHQLAEKKEEVSIEYEANSKGQDYADRFRASLNRDLMLQRSNVGIHKDDFRFVINSQPLKRFGSQGQQKSFVIALKLAQYEVLKDLKSFKPILLLDDIFDKLDSDRILQMINIVNSEQFGQVFITDAREERTKELFGDAKLSCKFILVNKGEVENEESKI